MPIIGTYNIAVNAATQAWVAGCIVKPGESLEVAAAGAVVFSPDSGSGASYAFPEGYYPADVHNSSHAFSPGTVGNYASLPVAPNQYPLSNTVPLSLGMLVRVDGTPFPAFQNYSNGLCPQRDTTYTWATLAAAAGITDPAAVLRVWFIFNDGLAYFGDNSGSFAITLTRSGASGGITVGNPLTSFIRPQLGIETTLGTSVAATRTLINFENSGFELSPEQTRETNGIAGIAYSTRSDLTTEMSKGSVKCIADYIDIGYLLSGALGAAQSSTTITGGVYQNVFEAVPYTPIVPQSYTVELPGASGDRVQKATGLVFSGIKIESERDKQLTLTASMFAKAISDAASASTGQNAVINVLLTGGTGGSFNLLFDNVSVSVLYNMTTSALQTAIQALGGRFASATVAGSSGNWNITIPDGAWIQLPSWTMGTLTGTSPTVAITFTTPGGMKMNPSYRVEPGDVSVSFASTLAGLDSAPTASPNQFATSIDIAERTAPVWRQNASDVGFGYVAQKKASEIKDMATFTMAYDATVATFIANSRGNNTGMYCRVKFTGPLIGVTGYNRSLTFDFYCVPTWKTNKDSQGNIRSVDFDLEILYDTAAGVCLRATLVNELQSYAAA